MLSNTSRYAIRALIYLAINTSETKKIGIKKIADDLDIPSPFLGKILQTLTRKKILSSTKGPNGGFGISESTTEVSLMEIVRIIDGDELFDRCLISNKTCGEKEGDTCSLHNHYVSIRKDINELFTSHTIGKLANEFDESGGSIVI